MVKFPQLPGFFCSSLFFLSLFYFGPTALAQNTITFTAAQVESGNQSYKEHCQICHGSTLSNGQFGTPLRGSFFRNNWAGKSLGELVQHTYESMPPDNVMLLSPEQYAEIVSFILAANNLEPGDTPISGNYQAMYGIPLPW